MNSRRQGLPLEAGAHRADHSERVPVVVTGTMSPNALGVVRAFGSRGIPVFYIDSTPRSLAKHSRYVSRVVRTKVGSEAEGGLIEALVTLARKLACRALLVPTGDREVLAIARHKSELERLFRVPVPDGDTVRQFLDKRLFYRLCAESGVAHPRTHLPETLDELARCAQDLPFPYLIKPSDSAAFQEAFHRKCFVVRSPRDLARAVGRLKRAEVDVLLQEIVPGAEFHCLYTYFNRHSRPIASCGYDKLRHWPTAFGSGSLCRSVHRPGAMSGALRLLRRANYHGFAEPEVKRDPRDGEYKLLEINVRTTLQNRLAAACGTDIEYLAYLESIGEWESIGECDRSDRSTPEGVLWTDDVVDQASALVLMAQREVGLRDMLSWLRRGTVHSVAALDDLRPLAVRLARLPLDVLMRLRVDRWV